MFSQLQTLSEFAMPRSVHVQPPAVPLSGVVDAPSSKNYTTRYILACCLAEGDSAVYRPAVQDDSVAMVRCCRGLGAHIDAIDHGGASIDFTVENGPQIARLYIRGFGSEPYLLKKDSPLNPGNAGAVFRLLLAASALLPEVRWETDYSDSLGKRPNLDLVDALRQLGVEVECAGDDGRLPMTLRGGMERISAHLRKRRDEEGLADEDPVTVAVSGAVSSQFTSALMFLAPLLDAHLRISVTGSLRSLPLIETTREVMTRAGVQVETSTERNVHVIRRGQRYKPLRWETNGDWPGSAAILGAAAAVPGSAIKLLHLFDDEQGEKECAAWYESLGCRVSRKIGSDGSMVMELSSPMEPLRGRNVNGDLCTDAVLAMMAVAMVADGESRFFGVRNLQFKECDRVREPIAELRKIYATAMGDGAPEPEKAVRYESEEDPDTIIVRGWPGGFAGGIDVDGRGDHRVIMMLSIVALRCRDGLTILGAEHIAKSFPRWFEVLEQMAPGAVRG